MTPLHQRINNVSHAVVNLVTALVVIAQLVFEVLHRAGVDTAGADWRVLAVAGGVKTVSQFIDSSYGKAIVEAASSAVDSVVHGVAAAPAVDVPPPPPVGT